MNELVQPPSKQICQIRMDSPDVYFELSYEALTNNEGCYGGTKFTMKDVGSITFEENDVRLVIPITEDFEFDFYGVTISGITIYLVDGAVRDKAVDLLTEWKNES